MKTLKSFFAVLFVAFFVLISACGPRAGKRMKTHSPVADTMATPVVEPVGEPLVEPVPPSEPAVEPDVPVVLSEIIDVVKNDTETTTLYFEDFSEDIAMMAVEEEAVERYDTRRREGGDAEIRGQRPHGAGVITAGEWNDLDDWEFWRGLLQREEYRKMPEYWGFEGIDRRPQHRTRRSSWGKRIVEVAFMVDATGSMSDELEFLKTELVDVVGRVEVGNPEAEIFTGSVFYRDEGDEYLTRLSPLTRSVDRTADFIKAQKANGGGDYPEAVHTALERSVRELQWTERAYAKILFMLLDAPPHHRPEVLASLHSSVERAAEKGIRIIPVVASGIDKETEFLMRFIAISTDGTYVFITDHSGVGSSHLVPSVGDYRIELLNDLIVRLINKYAE